MKMRHPLPPEDNSVSAPANNVVAVAIARNKSSQNAARWAINNLLIRNTDCPALLLIHVKKQNDSTDIDGINSEANGESFENETSKLIKTFSTYCTRKGFKPEGVVLEDNDVSKSLLQYINEKRINNLVLGASTGDVASKVGESAPEFCSVYVVANDKLQSVRPATLNAENLSNPETKLPDVSVENTKQDNYVSCQSSRDDKDFQERSGSVVVAQNVSSNPPSELDKDETQPFSPEDSDAELKRLKHELKQTIGMYKSASREAAKAKKMVREIQQWKQKEAPKYEQVRLAHEAALVLAKVEKVKCRAANEAAEKANKLADLEAKRRLYAELKVRKDAEAKKRALNVLSKNDIRYRKYTLEEIEAATDKFSESLIIGEGGYGPVYKGKLDHTGVAIKVLRSGSAAAQGKRQFQQEIEVLSSMRHPNMVLLLGACPKYGCLVYEYMNYGSLEDRLYRKGNTPSIPWRVRFKIAAEIATGLLFLHNAKPEPLVHRDLKPANILLDRNYTCKISDVGLSRLVPAPLADNVSQYRMTKAAGTFCYIDPEYQQTGRLGVKSDVYSFGIMLLQIITARPPMGLTHHVEKAIAAGAFESILDPSVPDWPVEEALSFAKIALKCAELKKKDRPNLGSVVLPELSRLREFGKRKSSHGPDHSSPNPSP
ncbi:U-box domain-containing protein 51-like [Apium graveolens]|uniref:U-box domain-containing protein 51-like n=1 Tax=Apium graveolens TaxID=4045 RepID=UPI003D794956